MPQLLSESRSCYPGNGSNQRGGRWTACIRFLRRAATAMTELNDPADYTSTPFRLRGRLVLTGCLKRLTQTFDSLSQSLPGITCSFTPRRLDGTIVALLFP